MLRQILLEGGRKGGGGAQQLFIITILFFQAEKREHPGSQGPAPLTVDLVLPTVTVNDWPEVGQCSPSWVLPL